MIDDKRAFLESAFPGQTFDDDQVKAMGEFVRACMESDEEEYEEGEEGESSGKGSDADIALILGAGPKKGSK